MNEMSDKEIFEIAAPIWNSLNSASNNKNYEEFSKQFSSKLKAFLTKERFLEQCNKHKLLSTLVIGAEPVACIRRSEGVGVVFKQLSSGLSGEFMGNLVLTNTSGGVEILDVTIY